MYYVEMLIQIICANFEKDRVKDQVHGNGKTHLLKFSKACFSLLCYSPMSKLLPSIVKYTGNNLLV